MSMIVPIMLAALIVGLVRDRLNAPTWMILLTVIALTIGWYAFRHGGL